MGALSSPPCCPDDLPADVTVRAAADDDMAGRPAIYAEGIATRNATFETESPPPKRSRTSGCPSTRWVAEIDGEVVGWTAITPSRPATATPVSGRPRSTSPRRRAAAGSARPCCTRRSTRPTPAGLWTLQTSIFPENRASLALHHSAGYRTLAVRDPIAQLDGVWRDTVLLERRSEVN